VRTAAVDEVKRLTQEGKEQWSAGLAQQERWKKEILETLAETSRKADALVKAVEARIEAFEDQGRSYGAALKDVAAAKTALEQLSATVKKLEERPVAVVAPPASPPAGSPPGGPPPPVAPPSPPPTPSDDTAALKEKVKKAFQDLANPDAGKVWAACMVLGKHGGLEAVEPLLKVLKENKDYYARLGAVTALGQLKACDAMPALIDALVDKESTVFTSANSALMAITGHTPERIVSADSSKTRRNEARAEWVAWWRSNEADVRAKLNQPAKAAAPGGGPGEPGK
jgi:HEAT repeat protein